MGILDSLANIFKSVKAVATSEVQDAADSIGSRPEAVKAKFDDVIKQKMKDIHSFRDALASMVNQKEKLIGDAKTMTDEVGKLENMKAGAAAKAKRLVTGLKAAGKSQTEIQANEEYQQSSKAFEQFSRELNDREGRITDLEQRAADLDNRISEHKSTLQTMIGQVDELRKEAAETVADISASHEADELKDLANISKEVTGNSELDELRQLRAKSKAEARIANELAGATTAGVATTDAAAEFLKNAEQDALEDDFAALVGLEDDVAPAAPSAPFMPPASPPAEGGAATDASDASGASDGGAASDDSSGGFKLPE